jgi:hypothetical protein
MRKHRCAGMLGHRGYNDDGAHRPATDHCYGRGCAEKPGPMRMAMGPGVAIMRRRAAQHMGLVVEPTCVAANATPMRRHCSPTIKESPARRDGSALQVTRLASRLPAG